jgi:hypothetical protein
MMLEYAVDNNKELGSSTFVVHHFDKKSSVLQSSYIGDSGYMILKRMENLKYVIQFISTP